MPTDSTKDQDAVVEKLFEVTKGKLELVVPLLRFLSDVVDTKQFIQSYLVPSFRFSDWHLADKKKRESFGALFLEFWRRVASGLDWNEAGGPHVLAESTRLVPLTSTLANHALDSLSHNLDVFLRLGDSSDAPSSGSKLDTVASVIWMSTEVMNHVKIPDAASCAAALRQLSTRTFQQLSSAHPHSHPRFFFRLQFVLSELLQAETLMDFTAEPNEDSDGSLVTLFGAVVDTVLSHCRSIFVLRAFRLLLQSVTSKSNPDRSRTVLATISKDSSLATRVAQLQERLRDNLATKSHLLRSVTISIFTLLNSISFYEHIPLSFTQDLLEEMQEVEDAPLNALESRSITVKIHRLKEILLQHSLSGSQKEQKNKHKRAGADTETSKAKSEADRVAIGDRELVLRFLFGLFHKNLVLLWPMTKEVLFFLAAQDYRRYWAILWPLFQTAIQRGPDVDESRKLREEDFAVEFDDGIEASEYASSDLTPLGEGASGDFGRALKLDVGSTEESGYARQLWECVCQMHKLTQYSAAEFRPLIDIFMTFIREKYPHLRSVDKQTTGDAEVSHFMDKTSKTLLGEFLKFFSQFKLPSTPSALSQKLGYNGTALTVRGATGTITAPAHLYQEDSLFETFALLLTHGNESIQRLSLDCVMLWKLDFLIPYREHLQRLCSPKEIRDAITAWRISKQAGEIQPQHRAKVAEYIISMRPLELTVTWPDPPFSRSYFSEACGQGQTGLHSW